MNRHYRRELEKIDEQAAKALSSCNYVVYTSLMKKKQEILDNNHLHEVEVSKTLNDALKDYSVEDRRELTTKIITAVAIADIMRTSVIDMEDEFRKFGISSVPLFQTLKDISKKLADVVATIDNVNNDTFTQRYIDVADKVESKVLNTLKNYIFNEVEKIKPKSNNHP